MLNHDPNKWPDPAPDDPSYEDSLPGRSGSTDLDALSDDDLDLLILERTLRTMDVAEPLIERYVRELQAEQEAERIQAQANERLGTKAKRNRLDPATILKDAMAADATPAMRKILKRVAEVMGIPLPMTRTKPSRKWRLRKRRPKPLRRTKEPRRESAARLAHEEEDPATTPSTGPDEWASEPPQRPAQVKVAGGTPLLLSDPEWKIVHDGTGVLGEDR